MCLLAKGSILDDVDERDRGHFTAQGWWLYRSMSKGDRGERVELEHAESSRAREAWRAYEVVQETVGEGGNDAIRLILALLAAAPRGEGTGAVGSGPLEDLIHDHGDDLVDAVERAARQSPEFAHALGSVAVEQGTLRPETADRLARWLGAP